MGLIEAFKKVVFENYVNFSGRARRQEYWLFALFMFLFNLVLGIIEIVSAFVSPILATCLSLLGYIISLGLMVPSLAVTFRRLHDIGKSGKWLLAMYGIPVVVCLVGAITNAGLLIMAILGIIVLVFAITLLVWTCTAGQQGPNKWGPDPKNPDAENEVTKAFE